MKRTFLFAALALAACERASEPAGDNAIIGPGSSLASQARATKPPAVVPKPEDQAKLDDMILAGYTPHADHLHAPGVNECPLTKGSDAVM